MSRPQRNRRLSRRVWSPENDLQHGRPVKRLFTPEIKRMLKDWLIRRRENPYPSRDEKKCLAVETGLTYTQICNWFANWRRKLKNSEREKAKNSWGSLIKNYNTNARGNVEQFSISSEDSIWEEDVEDEFNSDLKIPKKYKKIYTKYKSDNNDNYYSMPYESLKSNCYGETVKMEHSNYYSDDNNGEVTAQCFQVTSTTTDSEQIKDECSTNSQSSGYETNTSPLHKTKYKQKMMEKYLRDTYAQDQKNENDTLDVETASVASGAAELSKWLESAVRFTPDKNNYYVEWNDRTKLNKQRTSVNGVPIQNGVTASEVPVYNSLHHKDELDAAEALANLAFNCRQRMMGTNRVIQTAVKAISS